MGGQKRLIAQAHDGLLVVCSAALATRREAVWRGCGDVEAKQTTDYLPEVPDGRTHDAILQARAIIDY